MATIPGYKTRLDVSLIQSYPGSGSDVGCPFVDLYLQPHVALHKIATETSMPMMIPAMHAMHAMLTMCSCCRLTANGVPMFRRLLFDVIDSFIVTGPFCWFSTAKKRTQQLLRRSRYFRKSLTGGIS